MLELIKEAIEYASRIGFPIPLIIMIYVLFRILSSKVDHWSEREKYYYELISNLGVWKDTLADRLDYYQEPGSSFDDRHINTPHFGALTEKGRLAFQEIREKLNVARIFLSEKSILCLDQLISEHWLLKEHVAICTEDYLSTSFEIAEKTYKTILLEAKSDLKISRLSIMMKKLVAK